MNDLTLRRGDAVMTERGMVVFNGTAGREHRPEDFVALSRSGGIIGKSTSDELVAMDRVVAP